MLTFVNFFFHFKLTFRHHLFPLLIVLAKSFKNLRIFHLLYIIFTIINKL